MVYKTKQSELIQSCMQSFGDDHVTAASIAAALAENGHNVGIATIYRHLDKMEQEGLVRKYILDEKTGACYQFVGREGVDCQQHFHLKCEGCGKLIHLRCSTLAALDQHILKEHGFTVNPKKTVFYGVCEECQKKS